jgi:predicted Zn finger-like uncharacterized protein
MIIHCDNCRKAYKIDPAKMKSDTVSVPCKQCGEKLIITRDMADIAPASAKPAHEPPDEPAAESSAPLSAPAPAGANALSMNPDPPAPGDSPSFKRKFGLNTKMLLLFFFIPLGLVVAASALYLWELEALTKKISTDSHTIVERLSHELVNDTAKMVANQCKLYLEANPYMTREDLRLDAEFKALALQPLGETGYTCLYSIPDENGLSALWVHPNDRLIGVNLPAAMKKVMKPNNYKDFIDIYTGAYNGDVSSGYYQWQEKNGSFRDKYMTCVPIKGTPYIIAATTYVDEINRDVVQLKQTAKQMTHKTKMSVFGVFGITLMLMGSTVLFYSRRLKSNLTTLINAAEKISIGDLDTEIKVKTKDEISDLAETISRMQESIRLSIERLRRRR